jgi:hypothetical protein
MGELEEKVLEQKYLKFLKELYESIEEEEDEDKKVLRSYAWLGLQCLFEIKKLYVNIEQQNKQIIKLIKEQNKLLKEFKDENISKKQQMILDYVELNTKKLNAILKELNARQGA